MSNSPKPRNRVQPNVSNNNPNNSSTSRGADNGGGAGDRIGPYIIQEEIGKGSFAVVYRGVKFEKHPDIGLSQPIGTPVAVKAVIRSKLTHKLLENLESEIEILKGISQENIVELSEILKTDSHIYLIMFFCELGDLSSFIPKRHASGRGGGREMIKGLNEKYPIPPEGGLNEMVVRSFVGQLTQAIKFLRSRNIIHRDIKPQNLLLHPFPSPEDDPSPQIPILKVADFGFARWLPATSLAETLCGSPLYMAPEILRYEKYGPQADLWSVGAVVFEMCVGRAPYRADNHVELLKKIERGDGMIKWPDDRVPSGSQPGSYRGKGVEGGGHPYKVPDDIKEMVNGLLKRQPADRVRFEEYFERADKVDSRGVTYRRSIINTRETVETEVEEKKLNPVTSTASTIAKPESEAAFIVPPSQSRKSPLSDRSQPTAPSPSPPPQSPSPKSGFKSGAPPAPSPLNPNSTRQTPPPQTVPSPTKTHIPPITTAQQTNVIVPEGVRVRDYALAEVRHPKSNLTSIENAENLEDSGLLNKDYVLVEKQTVEINALADEVAIGAGGRTVRRNSKTFLSRQPSVGNTNAATNYPPTSNTIMTIGPNYEAAFAIPSKSTGSPSSSPLALYGSSPQRYYFPSDSSPRDGGFAGPLFRPDSRYSNSPLVNMVGNQASAIVKLVNKTSLKLFGNPAEGAWIPRRGGRRKAIPRNYTTENEINPTEEKLLDELEDLAHKSYVISHFADSKLVLLFPPTPATVPAEGGNQGVNEISQPSVSSMRRMSSSPVERPTSNPKSDALAAEALILYIGALAYLQKAIEKAKQYWIGRNGQTTSGEYNEAVQTLRSRFNDCYEKADFAKSRTQDTIPDPAVFAEKLIFEKALEISRAAAVSELKGENPSLCENAYETALWMLYAILDKTMRNAEAVGNEGGLPEEDRSFKEEDDATLQKFITSIQTRLEALHRKMKAASSSSLAVANNLA